MKKIPFIQSQLAATVYTQDSFPSHLSSNGCMLPEIAIAGRSNVGKSSLINHLLGKKLAKTSSTPGKTQSINFFCVDEQAALVDLPGYGYAKVSKQVREQWIKIIDQYFQYRSSLELILFLIDSRRELTEEDCAFVKWAAFKNKPMLLIFTKADKISENEKRKKTQATLAILKNLTPLSSVTHFLHYSIKDPRARIELIKQINNLLTGAVKR